MTALRWTSKSTRAIADELGRQGHPLSDKTVARCLDEMGYSLQANRKTQEGRQHPDRDAQFRYINRPSSPAIPRKKSSLAPLKMRGGRGGGVASRSA